ncbi:S-adenosyl-L-methionine-dependent methyltransferase [Hymenopellis radicata]|nr:S-adenosyl-L-methionine-dependent methyltransferase [Hymenopellis radicata]
MTAIYRAVEDHYTGISLSNDLQYSERVAKAFGYSSADLAAIPDDANLGLSCGNPLAIANIKKGETFLDLGSGGGLDVFLASQHVGPSGKCIGVDMNEQMLSLARRNAIKGNCKNVEFVKAFISALPIESATVDIVSSNCVINLVPEEDKPAVFTEVYRVLKPGGRVAISDILLKKSLPDILKNDLSLHVECIAGANTPEQYRQWMMAAGFLDIVFVDTKKDMSIYKTAPRTGCCSDSSGNEVKPVQLDSPSLTNLNEHVGAFQVYAVIS